MNHELSPREKEVVVGIANGLTRKEIAETLLISIKTIEMYRTFIGIKLKGILNHCPIGIAEITHYAIMMCFVKLRFVSENPIGVTTNTRLTPREIEVVVGIANGLCEKEIAEVLQVAFKTVDKHRQHAIQKLKAVFGLDRFGTSEIVHYAIATGLVKLRFVPEIKVNGDSVLHNRVPTS